MTEKIIMPWEITIKKVENGFICSWKEEADEEDVVKEKQQVFEEEELFSEETIEELKNMKNVLNFIKEYFGVYYSKHNKKNLIIKIEGEEE